MKPGRLRGLLVGVGGGEVGSSGRKDPGVALKWCGAAQVVAMCAPRSCRCVTPGWGGGGPSGGGLSLPSPSPPRDTAVPAGVCPKRAVRGWLESCGETGRKLGKRGCACLGEHPPGGGFCGGGMVVFILYVLRPIYCMGLGWTPNFRPGGCEQCGGARGGSYPNPRGGHPGAALLGTKGGAEISPSRSHRGGREGSPPLPVPSPSTENAGTLEIPTLPTFPPFFFNN